MNKEELLIEAKIRYPIGTHFKSAATDVSCIAIKEHYFNECGNICTKPAGNGLVYYEGIWATIVSTPIKKSNLIFY